MNRYRRSELREVERVDRTCASQNLIKRVFKKVFVVFVIPWIADIPIRHHSINRLVQHHFDGFAIDEPSMGEAGLISEIT